MTPGTHVKRNLTDKEATRSRQEDRHKAVRLRLEGCLTSGGGAYLDPNVEYVVEAVSWDKKRVKLAGFPLYVSVIDLSVVAGES